MHGDSDLPPNFRKSSYSSTDRDCVEVADLSTGGAAVRDTQNREAGHLAIPAGEWSALLRVVARRAA
ncbi:DUF397 domain-containing protein [Nocardiopsis sp. CC223A]|uniref:DUF397 domain-containing protein n=1 Tax=Nocardiopsis sp. CC223A TaxID=3044051 RepID=UPI00278C51DB|nr:DUF397 domain-containing protein [Nocardiopsis sp. CC223A]